VKPDLFLFFSAINAPFAAPARSLFRPLVLILHEVY
jgi:hypothetical protein